MTTPTQTDPPLNPEFPLAIGAGFLALAVASSFSLSPDQPLLVGFFVAAAVLAFAISVVMAWQ